MTSLFRGVDVVFHFACLGVRHSLHSPLENQEVNATGTLALLEIAMTTGVKRFVISTFEVYGMVHTTPIAEDHSTLPCTVYGASKLAGEAYALCFLACLRLPHGRGASFQCLWTPLPSRRRLRRSNTQIHVAMSGG
jgi:UDP-glucose 4-epimerase